MASIGKQGVYATTPVLPLCLLGHSLLLPLGGRAFVGADHQTARCWSWACQPRATRPCDPALAASSSGG